MAKKNKMPQQELEVEKPQAEEAPEPQAPSEPEQPKVSFDVWWAMNEKKIPKHHHKEIIKMDFGARGLSSKEDMQSYNEALKKYGLKLN